MPRAVTSCMAIRGYCPAPRSARLPRRCEPRGRAWRSSESSQGATARAADLDGGDLVSPSLRAIDQDASDVQRGERIRMLWCRRGDRRRDSSSADARQPYDSVFNTMAARHIRVSPSLCLYLQ